MSITLELSREEEALLQQAAFAAGSHDIAAFIRQQVFAALPPANPAPDDLTFLRAEGQNAIRRAQNDLLDAGIGYVYATDTALIRHRPDGTEEILTR